MRTLATRNMISEEMEYLTVDQAKLLYNLGTSTIKQMAKDAGAVRRIGGALRINRKVLSEYIEANFK